MSPIFLFSFFFFCEKKKSFVHGEWISIQTFFPPCEYSRVEEAVEFVSELELSKGCIPLHVYIPNKLDTECYPPRILVKSNVNPEISKTSLQPHVVPETEEDRNNLEYSIPSPLRPNNRAFFPLTMETIPIHTIHINGIEVSETLLQDHIQTLSQSNPRIHVNDRVEVSF